MEKCIPVRSWQRRALWKPYVSGSNLGQTVLPARVLPCSLSFSLDLCASCLQEWRPNRWATPPPKWFFFSDRKQLSVSESFSPHQDITSLWKWCWTIQWRRKYQIDMPLANYCTFCFAMVSSQINSIWMGMLDSFVHRLTCKHAILEQGCQFLATPHIELYTHNNLVVFCLKPTSHATSTFFQGYSAITGAVDYSPWLVLCLRACKFKIA